MGASNEGLVCAQGPNGLRMSGMVCEEQDENGLRKSSWAQAALARPSPFPGPSAPYLAGIHQQSGKHCLVSSLPAQSPEEQATALQGVLAAQQVSQNSKHLVGILGVEVANSSNQDQINSFSSGYPHQHGGLKVTHEWCDLGPLSQALLHGLQPEQARTSDSSGSRCLASGAFPPPGAALPYTTVLQVACDVAAGLAAIHGTGLAHGSVHPSNILLTSCTNTRQQGSAELSPESWVAAKLLFLGHPQRLAPALMQARAHNDAAAGAHVAPELMQGGPATAPGDVYGLGTLLYALLARRPAFAGMHPRTLAHVALSSLQPVFPPCPTSLMRLALVCMASKPQDRPSAAAVVQALKGYLLQCCHWAPPQPTAAHALHGSRPGCTGSTGSHAGSAEGLALGSGLPGDASACKHGHTHDDEEEEDDLFSEFLGTGPLARSPKQCAAWSSTSHSPGSPIAADLQGSPARPAYNQRVYRALFAAAAAAEARAAGAARVSSGAGSGSSGSFQPSSNSLTGFSLRQPTSSPGPSHSLESTAAGAAAPVPQPRSVPLCPAVQTNQLQHHLTMRIRQSLGGKQKGRTRFLPHNRPSESSSLGMHGDSSAILDLSVLDLSCPEVRKQMQSLSSSNGEDSSMLAGPSAGASAGAGGADISSSGSSSSTVAGGSGLRRLFRVSSLGGLGKKGMPSNPGPGISTWLSTSLHGVSWLRKRVSLTGSPAHAAGQAQEHKGPAASGVGGAWEDAHAHAEHGARGDGDGDGEEGTEVSIPTAELMHVLACVGATPPTAPQGPGCGSSPTKQGSRGSGKARMGLGQVLMALGGQEQEGNHPRPLCISSPGASCNVGCSSGPRSAEDSRPPAPYVRMVSMPHELYLYRGSMVSIDEEAEEGC